MKKNYLWESHGALYDDLMSKKKDGVSPLVVGLLHVLPSWLLFVSILIVIINLYFGNKEAVLGVQTGNYGLVKTTTREERVNELEDSLRKQDSWTVKKQIEKLSD